MSTPVRQARPSLDGEAFREAMSFLAAPLTVITTRDGDGRPRGFTASSVTSVSAAPPQVLVGISHTSSCYDVLATAAEFTINVLGRADRALARQFATSGVDRFAGAALASWPESDLPYLAGVPVALRCALSARLPVGDHDLLIGRLTDVRQQGPAEALVWYRRDFHPADD